MTINNQCRNCHFLETTPCETPLFWCGCPSKKELDDHISWVKFDAEGCSSFENRQIVIIVRSSSAPPIQPAPPLHKQEKSLEGKLIKGVAVASLAIVAAKTLGGELPPDWQKTAGTFFTSASGTGALVASVVGVTIGLIARWTKL